MEQLQCILLIAIPLIIVFLITPLYITWFKSKGKFSYNFKGEKVVNTGGGLLLVSLLLLVPVYYQLPFLSDAYFTPMILYLGIITSLGLIDDLFGDTQCKGFKGHLGKFFRKEGMSTGFIKAFGGLSAALLTTIFISDSWQEWIIKAVFLALSSNIFNLIDTRPGRAIKIYLVLSFIFVIIVSEIIFLIIPLWSALQAYLYWEMKTEVMLGDAGAYLLGGVLGFYAAVVLPVVILMILTLFLIYVHWYGEKYSINRLIEGNKWLYYLDHLGRRS